MFSKPILATFLITLASTASAQSFEDVVNSIPELSLFASLLALPQASEFTSQLRAPQNSEQTILVPNNDAVEKFLMDNEFEKPSDVPANLVLPFLSYHVLLNNVTSGELAMPGGSIVETRLKDEKYTLLKDDSGQVVYGKPNEDNSGVEIESGLKEKINVVTPDVAYNNGLLHIVDGLLTLPKNCSTTISHLGADRLVQYIKQVELIDELDSTPGATCFAPADEAIDAAAPVLRNLTDQQLIEAIQFHTLLDPFYTNDLSDGMKLKTWLGPEITVNIRSGQYFFNGVRARSTNDIARNGVAYVLDGIMPTEFDGTIPDTSSTFTVSSTSSTAISSASSSTAIESGAPATTTSAGAPSATADGGSGAGAVKVGGSIILAGFAALALLM
ncbi:Stabilin-2 [Dactylella cylindrospora]|nr:Stabilin-2 [Dactylella cylindrospora]